MFFEVLSLTYHISITIDSLTHCVSLRTLQYASRAANRPLRFGEHIASMGRRLTSPAATTPSGGPWRCSLPQQAQRGSSHAARNLRLMHDLRTCELPLDRNESRRTSRRLLAKLASERAQSAGTAGFANATASPVTYRCLAGCRGRLPHTG